MVCYGILCCGLICLVAIPDHYKFGIIAAIGAFAVFLLAFSIQEINFGFYAMIVFGFLLAFIDRATESRLPLYTLIFIMPFVLFILVMVKSIFQHDRFKLGRHPLVYGYFITVAYTMVQLFNPQMDSLMGWVSYFRQSLALVALFLTSLYLFRNFNGIRLFFRFLFGAIFITALYGCVQQWIGLAPADRIWVYSNPDVLGLYRLPGGGIRKFSFLTDPANFGTLMAAGAVGTLILAMELHSKKKKALLAFFTIVIFLGMSYSGTRTANVMIAAGLGLYIVMTLYQRRTRLLAVTAVMLFLFIMNAPIYGNVTINRFRTAFQPPSDNASLDTRLINRQKIRPYILSHPFGGGVNTTGVTGGKYNPHHPLAGIPPDSSLVANLMENGWVGLAIHMVFLFFVIAYAVHYYFHCHDGEIKAYYAVIAAILFSLGLIGAYAQYTLTSVPQIFVFIPLIAVTIRLHTFDKLETSNVLY